MIRPTESETSCTQLGERCRSACDAYERAARALDIGLRRQSGATPSEWKAEHDARIDLRRARAAYVDDALRFTAVSQAYHAAASLLSTASRRAPAFLPSRRRP